MSLQCLLERGPGDPATQWPRVRILLRFLHVQERTVERLEDGALVPTGELVVDGRSLLTLARGRRESSCRRRRTTWSPRSTATPVCASSAPSTYRAARRRSRSGTTAAPRSAGSCAGGGR